MLKEFVDSFFIREAPSLKKLLENFNEKKESAFKYI
jgi:hypothetical protein